ncbi:ribosomal protein S5 domain 2-like protein [Trametes elegans]|nr:ribosomal protein S5 domain 2-like protein [Trametes elegans]
MATLDSFVKFSRPPPTPLATSQEVRDRGSAFVANVYAATSPEEASRAVHHLRHVTHGSRPATHEIAAWRCMVVSGYDDDGEKYAGGRVLKVMQAEGVIDAVVVVSRWYGGEMLGPARFDHIETCAREVCRTFRLKDDMSTCIATLISLDDILASLRAELAALTAAPAKPSGDTAAGPAPAQADGGSGSVTAPPVPSTGGGSAITPIVVGEKKSRPSYAALEESLDLAKAKRLVTARENSIRSVKQALQKARIRASGVT